MATRRSTRLANATLKPQENMIFPPNIMSQITGDYVDIFQEDTSCKILPLLTCCHLVSRLVIPHLYRDVKLVEFSHTERRKAVKTLTEAVKKYGRENRELGRLGADSIVLKQDDYIGLSLVTILNPATIESHIIFLEAVLEIIQQYENPRLKVLAGPTDPLTRTHIHLQPDLVPTLDALRLHVTPLRPVATAEMLESITEILPTHNIEVYISAVPHVFCFEGVQESVRASTLNVTLKRGCPGEACSYDRVEHPLTEQEVEIRNVYRPEVEASHSEEDE